MALPGYLIKVAQHACSMGEADIDGLLGPKTIAAAREYDTECEDFEAPRGEARSLITMVAQHACGLRGADLDGMIGPKTKQAALTYIAEHNIVTAAPTKPARKSSWAMWRSHENPGLYVKNGIDLRDPTVIVPPGGLDPIPTRKQRDAVYGDARALGEAGMRAKLKTITGLPGRFNKGTGTLPAVHKKVVPHIKLAFELWDMFEVLDEIYKIWFFNYRHMRHDPSRPLSLHSWGIACDINAKENYAWVPKGPDKKIRPFAEGWSRKHPKGLSEIAVLCMKKAGFTWGGDWASFRDAMHFQLLA